MSFLSLALNYWKEGLVISLVLTAGLSIRGCVQERDQRIQAEALSKERLAEFRQSKETADSLHKALARTDSQVAVAQSHISELRRVAERKDSIAQAALTEASSRLTAAGDSLSATLDSLYAVVPTALEPLARKAKVQHREEQRAQREVANQLANQLEAHVDMLAAADSTARLWERRHATLTRAYEARGEALERAEKALETRQEQAGGDFFTRVLWGFAGAGVGAVAVSLVR